MMNNVICLAKRNILETIKDYVSLIFCLGFPIIMLIAMNILFGQMAETPMFHIENLAPGICTFGYAFTMLYVALTITVDKSSAFMTRILVSPVKLSEYLLSFIFSAIPIMLAQTIIFYIIALFLGLGFNGSWFLSIVLLIPSMIFYSVCGVLIGVLAKTDKQAGPFSSIIISGSGILGGVWMPIETMSHTFVIVCKFLPFYSGVLLGKQAIIGFSSHTLLSLAVMFVWIIVLTLLSIFALKRTAKN